MDSEFMEGCRYASLTKPNELCPACLFTTYAYAALSTYFDTVIVRGRNKERKRGTERERERERRIVLYLILQRHALMNRRGML